MHATRVVRTRIRDPRCTLSGNSIGGLDLGASLDCTVHRPTQWRNAQVRLESFGQPASRQEIVLRLFIQTTIFSTQLNGNSFFAVFFTAIEICKFLSSYVL